MGWTKTKTAQPPRLNGSGVKGRGFPSSLLDGGDGYGVGFSSGSWGSCLSNRVDTEMLGVKGGPKKRRRQIRPLCLHLQRDTFLLPHSEKTSCLDFDVVLQESRARGQNNTDQPSTPLAGCGGGLGGGGWGGRRSNSPWAFPLFVLSSLNRYRYPTQIPSPPPPLQTVGRKHHANPLPSLLRRINAPTPLSRRTLISNMAEDEGGFSIWKHLQSPHHHHHGAIMVMMSAPSSHRSSKM